MNKTTIMYIRSINKHLTCSFSTKRKLIKRFETALSNYLDDNPDATTEMLYTAFGSPEEMANVLMHDLPQKEHDVYLQQKRLFRRFAGIILTLLLCFAMYVFFLKQKPIVSNIEITPYESTTTSPTTHPID